MEYSVQGVEICDAENQGIIILVVKKHSDIYHTEPISVMAVSIMITHASSQRVKLPVEAIQTTTRRPIKRHKLVYKLLHITYLRLDHLITTMFSTTILIVSRSGTVSLGTINRELVV